LTDTNVYAGGCLCGALRYEAAAEPLAQGYCFCRDCRKASGSGFIPFLLVPAVSVRFTGKTMRSFVKSARGSDAVRNHCAACGGLVFGGLIGESREHTLYAGSLDEPALFQPTMAIFTRDKPEWVSMPAGLKVFATLPGM